jgi:hypothetical protein
VKLSLILFTILNSFPTWAQDESKEARLKQKYTSEQIKRFQESKIEGTCTGNTAGLSLYDPGRTLHGTVQQDQDGLNTCYANTASLVLKSYNPDLPTPSYLDLASFNEASDQKLYDFDYGNTCYILNKVKEANSSLCSDEILENQPVSLQDDTLKKLYDVINTYHYTPTQMIDVLKKYEGFLAKNPLPNQISCAENDRVNLEKYINSRIDSLMNGYTYANQQEWTQADDEVSERCASLVKERMLELKILVNSESGESKNYYGDFEMNPKLRSELNEKYLKQMKKNQLGSGKSQFDFFVGLLDSKATSRATYEHVLGGGVRSDQYQQMLAKIATEVNGQVLLETIQKIAYSRPDIQACFDKAGGQILDASEGLFFNSALGDCFKEQNQWRREINEFTMSCHDPEKDLFLIFRNLSALDQSVNDIEKYLVNNNKNILKQIIDNNCKQKNRYQFPAGSCTYQGSMALTATLEKPENYPFYQMLQDDLSEFFQKNKNNSDEINYNDFASFWMNKYDGEDKTKAPLSAEFVEDYRKLLQNSYEALNFDRKQTQQEFLSVAKNVVQSYMKKNSELAQKIQTSIRLGHAVGISTCGSLFSDAEKQKYPNCRNHAVTATGTKCVNGRLKIELTNSWGIGCAEEKSSRHMFECQRDQDGLTNGRAWVDFDYLSDQGMGLYSF